ncbi:ABC transporter related protein [Chromohalobacter israelensis DSM 3043]|uniref:Energy-dependent translational throttle protein EttA n=2 Tax=Halomonadaceae TaxID=28256 RepID=Q1QU85_CHRI1|nr:ABC transporter related protein [Chromohalobacter salexigens DSM 3043]
MCLAFRPRPLYHHDVQSISQPNRNSMAQYVYTMNRVGKIVPPKREILKDISLSFFPGAKIGVLGLNGAGKSTLLRIMAGVDTEYNGEARPMPGINIGYLPQEPELDDDKSVRETVEEALSEVKAAQEQLEAVYVAYAEPDADFDALAAEQARLENLIEAADAHNIERKLEVAAEALRLPPWDARVGNLSGGERRRVALCRLLLSSPDMLLLDEPTNHLDAESVAWLERFLHDYSGTVVAITHDRYFLDNVAGWILELDRGQGIPFEGNYSQWLESKEKRLEQEAKQEVSRQKAIKQELEWVRSNAKGRQAKSKARLNRFEEMQSGDFQKRNETNEIYIPPGPRLGDKVIEFHDVAKRFDDKLLFENLSFQLPKGAIVGIVGGNGAGKSTLFKLIAGKEQPDSGEVVIGDTVDIAYVEQLRDHLDDKQTVWEAVSDGQDMININGYEVSSRAYVGRFNFKGNDQQKRLSELSGGERGRLQLAQTLKQGANVLLLDEPSNDLDIETLRALEEALLAFPGCALVISHDRWFLDRIATHILAYEGESHVEFFEGNYSEYEQDHRQRVGSDTPTRMKYKRIDA